MGKMKKVSTGLFGLLLIANIGVITAAEKKKPAAKAPDKAVVENGVGPMDQPMIMVDGEPVTSREYATFLQGNPTLVSRATSSEEGKAAALREMVSGYLIRKAMYAEGLVQKSETQPSQGEVIKAYEKLAEKHFPLPPNPDEKQAYAYYEAHPAEFGIPQMNRFNEVLFKAPKNADPAVDAAARERAEKALKRLEAGEKFDAVAVELTENPIGKVAKGDIGYVNPEDESWMKDAVKNLKVGDRTGILRSPTGYVILQMTDIRPGLISPYGNVRDKVIKNLRDAEQKKLRDAYVKGLAKDSKIEVVMPEIKVLFPNGVFP